MADAAHQSQLKNSKYKNWIKAGLGLKYVNEGLKPFCDDLISQQHIDILNKLKQRHNVTIVKCGTCQWQTLQPDHVQTKSKQCPLGQVNCNCRHPGGKVACPNNVCGAIYDEIIKLHASTPPAPYWKNTDAQHWCTDQWSIAKCFINAPGYAQKLPPEIDSSGLLHIIINNKGLHSHIQCVLSGNDVFSKVRECRNTLFHCNAMEVEDSDMNMYLDDMIAVLQDGKELIKRHEAQAGVQKLLELKGKDFVITSTDEDEVKSDMATLSKMEQELKLKLETAKNELDLKGSALEKRIDQRLKEVENTLVRKEITLDNKFDEKVVNIEKNLEQKEKQTEMKLEQKGNEIEVKLKTKQTEMENKFYTKGSEIEMNLDTKAIEIEKNFVTKSDEIEKKFDAKDIEIEKKYDTKASEIEKSFDIKSVETEKKFDTKGKEIEKMFDAKATEIEMKLCTKTTRLENELEQKANDIENKLCTKESEVAEKFEKQGTKVLKSIDKKETEMEKNLEEKEAQIERKFDYKMREVENSLDKKGTELKQRQIEISADMKNIITVETIYKRNREENKAPRKETDKNLQKAYMYREKKKDFQREMIQLYKDYVVKVSALPIQPERRMTTINEVYVDPWLTVKKHKSSKEETEVTISMPEIFRQECRRKNNIYVVGEAGSGKSCFCKCLVHSWCLAHSTHKTKLKDELAIIEEMKNFEFLFYITLRHNTDCDSVHTMLSKQYSHHILDTVLSNEPENCLIILDGLDEWSQEKQVSQFQTKGLPTRDLRKGYTVLTTSRPWKFHSLNIHEREIHLKVDLKGIHPDSIKIMTKKSIKILNAFTRKDKSEIDFEERLKKCSVSSITHIPIILQQLICLWFNDKFQETSMIATYTNILELILQWTKARSDGDYELDSIRIQSKSSTQEKVPEYLNKYELCNGYSYAIHHLSRLAFETLFGKDKDQSLTFRDATLQRHNIPDILTNFGMKTGILVQDKRIRLSEISSPVRSTYSFLHKSVQEYLAAVHIATEFEGMTETPLAEKCKRCAMKYLKTCRTVEDILDKSNVFVMLCGLEPCLISHITMYIYIIVNTDQRLSNYRHLQPAFHPASPYKPIELWNGWKFYEKIQECIDNCIKECNCKPFKSSIHIRDITSNDLLVDRNLFGLNEQIVCADNVRSISINLCCSEMKDLPTIYRVDSDTIYKVLKHLTEFVKLKAMACLQTDLFQDVTIRKQHDEKVAEILVKNWSTLESVVLISPGGRLAKYFVTVFPKMHHITTLILADTWLSHNDCCTLSTILTDFVKLQQLSLSVNCSRCGQHEIDLSKHVKLQYVEINNSFFVSSLNTNFLEICSLSVNVHNVIHVCNGLRKAEKLKNIALGTYGTDSMINRQMVMLLPYLTSPITLCLHNFTFCTDTIIALPSDMNNLKEIELIYIGMDLRVWCKFIDSLIEIPHAVHVYTSGIFITELKNEWKARVSANKAAHRYVKEKIPFYRMPKNWSEFYFCSKEF
ncbi:uncharacterized protein LOC123550235 [Mercenaria mercenaria]|uniref:uncharacterized protein LOC123550235 n=1 Tax=Mercenaria mercenaria TaxID=6596 RepID=UPI00234ED064|nr:uncharacterized protein LOC123550235 [Mercenaria mercenaria]